MKIEEIVLFEKLLVFYRWNRLRPFEYQQDRLEAELHIKRTRLKKARDKFIKDNILIEVNPGNGKRLRFSLNKDGIIAMLPKLFKLPEDKFTKDETIKDLTAFYTCYLSKKYLGEGIDDSTPDHVLAGEYSVIGSDKRKIEVKDSEDDSSTNNIADPK